TPVLRRPRRTAHHVLPFVDIVQGLCQGRRSLSNILQTASLIRHDGTIGPVGLATPWASRLRLADPVSMTTTSDPIHAGPVPPAEPRDPSSPTGARRRTVLGFVATRPLVEVILLSNRYVTARCPFRADLRS